MTNSHTHLLALIDAYARAAAKRADCRSAAAALVDARKRMLAARAAVAETLGIAAAEALDDETTRLADDAIAREVDWQASIDSALAGLRS